jgi:hypothetical protein
MEILQKDIFGNDHKLIAKDKPNKVTMTQSSSRSYGNISLENGLLETFVSNDAILIHRILQRKLIYSGFTSDKQRAAFLQIFDNEMRIKRGKVSPVTAARDSLLAFFTLRYI